MSSFQNNAENPSAPVAEASAPAPRAPEALRERLQSAVLSLFSDRDFHQVNMRAIYERSGVSPSTIYKYYASKEDLVFSILDEKVSEIAKEVEIHIQGLESTREAFRKIFWVTLDYYDRNPGVAITAFITIPLRSWMRSDSYIRHDSHAILREVYRRGVAREELDPNLNWTDILDQYFMYCYRQIHKWYFHGMETQLTDELDAFFPIFWKTVSR